MLESILNHLGADRLQAYSAGSHPTGQVHPLALRLLAAQGHDPAELRSKSWDEFASPDAPTMDVVITVCGSAAGEVCPIWPGAPIRTHWETIDPAAAPEEHQIQAFAAVFAILNARARAFLSLHFEAMDKARLSAELSRIGENW